MEDTIEHQSANPNTSISNKCVLVIGGAGYIGSHICKVLSKNGHTPIVIDHNIEEKPWATSFGLAFNLNLPQEMNRLDEIVKRYNVDSCMHLAAYTAVGESVKNPTKYYKNNVVMTLQLLDYLHSAGIKKFIFSSSAAVYGIPKDGICRDSDESLKPINPYGASKLMIEQVLRDYNTAYDFNSISLRYFNAAGADPDAEVGELRSEETHIIPLAIKAAMSGKGFKLNGDDYNTEDGTCVRDYIHVMDIADAHLKSLNLVGDEIKCASYNLGSGIPTSNKQMLDSVQKYAGNMEVTINPRREGDPDMLVADISRTKADLNWNPDNSSIDNIVSTAVKWNNTINKKKIN
jgi:UDP-glucose-4-epimerase GalE